jgi:carbon-monoxide dehydrogenase medium subunit
VIPGEFDYHAPASLRDAVDLLGRLEGAKVLGGGMSLIPAMKHRLALPAAVVDVGGLRELAGIRVSRGRVAIGGATPHAAIAAAAELADVPILRETAAAIGDMQVRNRGTLGGSLVHADPAADWPATFLALDGEATLLGPDGERSVAAQAFFTGMLTSAARANEILTEVRLAPARKRAGAAYAKRRQPASGFAIVGVAAQVVVDRKGRCESAGVGVTGANPVPFRAASLEAGLVGRALDGDALREACARIDELDPMEDLHASADYRAHLVSVYAARALRAAYERATA